MSRIQQFMEHRVRNRIGEKLPTYITSLLNGVVDPLLFTSAKL